MDFKFWVFEAISLHFRKAFSGIMWQQINYAKSDALSSDIIRYLICLLNNIYVVPEMAEEAAVPAGETAADGAEGVSKNKRYRKPKPWDTDDIDHWKIEVCAWRCVAYLISHVSFYISACVINANGNFVFWYGLHAGVEAGLHAGAID
jgi:hypothetical protein